MQICLYYYNIHVHIQCFSLVFKMQRYSCIQLLKNFCTEIRIFMFVDVYTANFFQNGNLFVQLDLFVLSIFKVSKKSLFSKYDLNFKKLPNHKFGANQTLFLLKKINKKT